MKKKIWIVIGIAALYFIYLPLSLIWSAIDTGNGMERSVTLLKTVKRIWNSIRYLPGME